MMIPSHRISLHFVWALFTIALITGPVLGQKNLINNGDFNQVSRQGQIKGWTGQSENFKVVRDGRQRVLIHQFKTRQHSNTLTQIIPIQKDWVELTFSTRIKARGIVMGEQSWQGPRVSVAWFDNSGKVLGYDGTLSINKDTDWTILKRSVIIPEGAVRVKVDATNFGKDGTVWFDDITVNARKAGELPTGQVLFWGKERIERLSNTRGRVVLNGWWRFSPLLPDQKVNQSQAPERIKDTDWGWISVPGNWGKGQWPPVPVSTYAEGLAPGWSVFDRRTTTRAWYERELNIPSAWRDRQILLDFNRVSTDAWIYIDNKYVGEVNWPYGKVDITKHVRAGRKAMLRVLVLATPEKGKVRQYMETATRQVTEVDAKLHTRGISGDVILESRPKGAHISDVFVITSVRQQKVTMDIALTDVKRGGRHTFKIEMLDERGRVEKTFEDTANVKRVDEQRVKFSFDWQAPRLWDIGQPNLYTARVTVTGPDLKDTFPQRFGFREFWIEGRDYFLNGRRVRLRPGLYPNVMTVQEIDASIDRMSARGFNMLELWPVDHFERSAFVNWEWFADRADRKGMLLTGATARITDVIRSLHKDPKLIDEWQARMERDLKRYRNHPSIIMWATSANFLGNNQDQNPIYLGMKEYNDHNVYFRRAANAADQCAALIKAFDPTRPTFNHQGGYVGDVHTVNMYLNMIQVQEREEWLSHYVKHGVMPFWPVEFGLPINITMRRGRNTHSGGDRSEPLMTEWTAQRLGRAAYQMEEQSYRDGIRKAYDTEKKEYRFRQPEIWDQAAFQELLRQDITRVWRSWRTWDFSGGMLPWNDGHAFDKDTAFNQLVDTEPYKPDMPGPYLTKVRAGNIATDLSSKMTELPAGIALRQNNSDTLAWIAGGPANEDDPGAFTSKRHNYLVGDKLEKQLIFINDKKTPVKYRYSYSIEVDGKRVHEDQGDGEIKSAENLHLPITFKLPRAISADIVDGVIRLTASIDGQSSSDVFKFHIFSEKKNTRPTLTVFDTDQRTVKRLRDLGYNVKLWRGGARPERMPFVIIGEHAMNAKNEDINNDGIKDGTTQLPGDLKAYVQAGGRVLILPQDKTWMYENLRWRVNPHVMRYTFAIDPKHPVVHGLKDQHLSNWAGSGSVVESHPKAYTRIAHGRPYHGWRWGNRGSVASAAVEKPHRTGWTPIIETGFDLAYAAVMQMNYGEGKVVYCGMDLLDQAPVDPAARRVLDQLIDYTMKNPITPRAKKTVYIGSEKGKAIVDLIGVKYVEQKNANGADLIISDDARWIGKARRVLILPQSEMGRGIQKLDRFSGSIKIPNWPVTMGLSPSDLRWRVDGPALVFDPNSGDVAADGLIRRTEKGETLSIESQINPMGFNTESEPYFRYTAWRQTRALAQLAANMGASFHMDDAFFELRTNDSGRISLARPWKLKMTRLNPIAATPKDIVPDKGLSKIAEAAIKPRFNDRSWKEYMVPSVWDNYGGEFQGRDGEGVYRVMIKIPREMRGRELLLSLGEIGDHDTTYVNGIEVGKTHGWRNKRVYRVPTGVNRGDQMLIVIRVYDPFYFGGLRGDANDLHLSLPDYTPPQTPYHPDFIPDFDLGDDPYRYYRW